MEINKKGAFRNSVQRCNFLPISMSSVLFFQGMDINSFKEAFESPKVDFILSHAMYCRDILKLKKGQRAVISNGRVRSTSRRDIPHVGRKQILSSRV